jgi:predicted transcriptional regulator
MITIRPRTMPRFWWLCPWAYARVLHTSANAVKAYADRLDDILDIQRDIIEKQADEIRTLKDQVNYWQVEAKTDHARWLRTLEENDALRKKGSQS